MAQKSMKGTQAFQDTIRTYLDKMAESDALFAVKYANPSKYNPQNEMFAAFETNRSLLKNETYPKFKKFSPGFAGV